MAEERIIDEEYGRGVKLRKTKDGYVDVTDELAEEETEEGAEEVSFEFPVMEEEDDEDLVGLSTEEALALKKQKAEAAERRRAEYEQAVEDGNALLEAADFEAAEKKFEAALQLDEIATEASVGYWRAKTENFQKPEVLVDEYLEEGMECMRYDLGFEAVEIIKKAHRKVFESKFKELEKEEPPLAEEVEGKQMARRAVLKERLKKSAITFAAAVVPMLVFIILTVVFGCKIPTVRDNRYIPVTIVFGALSLVAFIVFIFFANKLLNVGRIYRRNERLSSTEDGERLQEIRAYKDLYGELLRLEEEAEEQAEEVIYE